MGVVHKGPPQGEGVWSNEDTRGQRVKESRTLRTSAIWYFFLLGVYGAVHKVRHAIFDQFLPLSPVTLCHTSRDPPESTSHISDPPFLEGLVQKTRTKAPCTNSVSIVRGGFCPGVLSGGLLSGRFCPGWFLSVAPSVRMHLLQQKVKHPFKFHVSYVR